MKILYSALILAALTSCTEKKVYVPQSDVSLVTNLVDYSTISMLYEPVADSVTIDVKDNGIITKTNWLYQIDKRLPLRLIIPQVQRLQARKIKKSKEELMPSYYAYMDTLAKAVAYMPINKIEYADTNKVLTPDNNFLKLNITSKGEFLVNNKTINLQDLNQSIETNYPNEVVSLYLQFDKNISFENYMQTKLQLAKITLPNVRLAATEGVY